MAIFIALIFQVLFVAFAMAINIGLVVHDKINLQNAADLAAYYAAQRQAEMLNVIAHQNYQIRQAYKLMAWRYRVMGSGGNSDHPSIASGAFPPEAPYTPIPSLCISRKPLFAEIGQDDSICKNPTFELPDIFVPPPIVFFDPIALAFLGAVKKAKDKIEDLCSNYGVYNYMFTANAIGTFRVEQATRKKIILALAGNMAKPFAQMSDLNGDPVEVGVQKTFLNNLTYENRNSVGEITTFNSIQGIDPKAWLNEIPIQIAMVYTDVKNNPCASRQKMVSEPPGNNGPFSPGEIDTIAAQVVGPPPGNIMQLSLGFEKNPWLLVYAGVKVTSRPRQIFWPFGSEVTFTATAFAQPFGGRVGPWYSSTWQKGASASSGNKVDPVAPPLYSNEDITVANAASYLPNYGRFPGDTLGLSSRSAQAALSGFQGLSGSFYDYLGTTDLGVGRPNDTLPFNPSMGATGGQLRQFELAAIAPDLFDINYYSIDPNWGGVGDNLVGSGYQERLKSSRSAIGIPDDVPILGDHGSREDSTFSRFSVKDQFAAARGAGPIPLQRPEAPWFVRERQHLLVDWVHGDSFATMMQINPDRFGECEEFDDKLKIRAPGNCVGKGGRTGYSVKIVSPQFLRFGKGRYGGGDPDTIANPPPENF